MTATTSGWDIAGIVGGGVAMVSAIGSGIWRLITHADRKAASIDQKEAELIDRLDARVQSLEERDEKRETEHRQALAKLDRVLTACTLMVKDYELHTPGSPILAQARALLVRDYPHLFNTRVKRPT